MFAFGDDLISKRVPIATYGIALLCSIAFVTVQHVSEFAFVPIQFSIRPAASLYRLITAQFLHADVAHLIGNLVFLFAFGRGVETLVGRWAFTIASLCLGALSFVGSWLISPDSQVPIIGLSGSLSFLLGAYTALFPRARLKLLPFISFIWARAWLFAAIWISIQVVNILFVGEAASGVAYGTHIAGFVIGIVSAAVWKEFALDTDRLISTVADGEPR